MQKIILKKNLNYLFFLPCLYKNMIIMFIITEPVIQDSPDISGENMMDSYNNKEMFDQFFANLTPPDREKVEKAFTAAKSISILITGKTGTGKSTLLNGLLAKEVAKEGDEAIEIGTNEVISYTEAIQNVNVTIWDSPGLQDSTNNLSYLQKMKEQCSKRDLSLYCISAEGVRFLPGDNNPDVVAMKKLTRAFGPEFWTNTIIVLTFSNNLIYKQDVKKLKTEKERIGAIQKKLRDLEKQIKIILTEDVKLDRDFVDTITFVAAGHYSEPHLPGQKYWLSNLWFRCIEIIPGTEAKLSLFKTRFDNMKRELEVGDDVFANPVSQHPIVYDEINADKVGKTILKGILGAVVVAAAAAVGCSIL